MQRLHRSVTIEHWQFKRDRDCLVVTRTLRYSDGRIARGSSGGIGSLIA